MSQVWYSAYLPISASGVFDRFGSQYNTSAVIDLSTASLNVTALEAYSPLYIPITYVGAYFLQFALATASIVHTALYFGPAILESVRAGKSEDEDIHAKLMHQYPEVPDWWYWLCLTVVGALSIVTVAVRPISPSCLRRF